MKWLVGAFILLALSGCLSGDDGGNAFEGGMFAGHWTWRGGGEFWSPENSTLYLYDESYAYVSAYNLTREPIHIEEKASYMWITKETYHRGPQLRPLDADLENEVLVDQTTQAITAGLGLGVELELQQTPYANFHTLTTDALPTSMDVYVHGAFSNVELEIRSHKGTVFKGTEFGSNVPLLSPTGTARMEGEFFPENLSGVRYDVLVKAEHLNGFVSITYQEVAQMDRGYRFPQEEVGDVAFVYGTTFDPVSVTLAGNAESLILRSPENQTSTVILTDGENTGEITVYDTVSIPTNAAVYGIAPVLGQVTIGTDAVPPDFEMKRLETTQTTFSSGQQNTGRHQQTWFENATLVGIPYKYDTSWDGNNLSGCIDYGVVKIYDQNQTYAAWAPGIGHGGFIWNAKDVTVEISSTNQPCAHRIITFTSFLF